MNNRAIALIAAVALVVALAWYVVPLPDGDSPAEPPASSAPVTQPVPAPAPDTAPKQ